MTAIKICGITRAEDASLAAKLGAHAVGFILWPASPRYVDLASVARIVAALPPLVSAVGVFVNPSADVVSRAVAEGGITLAQIHGSIPEWAGGRSPVRILQVVRLGSDDRVEFEPAVSGGVPVLIDAQHDTLHGGTGKTVDWNRAAAIARQRTVVLAGGLTSFNVGEAIKLVRPYAVDVASGVEASPGVKDHLRLREFVEAVRRADDDEWSSPSEEIL